MDESKNQSTAPQASAKKGGLTSFVRETQAEIAKVTWPTRRETMITTVMIIVMALVTGVFFLAIDSVLGFAIGHFLGMNS
ncbi:MAG: preprotein translocase subunit SecE [Bdellovibrionales bacterium]